MDWGPGCFQPLHHGVDHGGAVGQPVVGVTRESEGDGLAAMASLGCLRVCVRGGGRWMGRGSHYSILACLRGGGRPAASVCGRGVRAVLVQHVTPCADIYTRLYRLAAPCRVVSLLHVDELPFVLPLSVRGMRGMLESLSVYTVSLYDKCILYSVFC